MVFSPPKAPYITREGEGYSRPPGSKYSSRTYVPGIVTDPTFYPREDEYGNRFPPYIGPLGTFQPGSVYDPRSRAPTVQKASYNPVLQAMLDRTQSVGSAIGSAAKTVGSAAKSAAQTAWSGAKAGADVGYHAGAGLVGAPQGASRGSGGQLFSPVSGTFARNSSNVYGAARDGGSRQHSGIDWRAENGSSVYSMAGGKVLYTGTNQGYGSNIVIQENDGTIRRYATHNSVVDARPGTTVRAGQVIGAIGSNHLHYEEIPQTINGKPNPVYAEMVSHPGKFVSTSRQRGTVNPVVTLGLQPGTAVQGGLPLSRGSTSNPRDSQVAAMQQQLNAQGANIAVDGIMGPQTRAAMAKYQAPAQAYAPVPASSPAQQAVAGQAYGRPDPQVAAMQRDLNSRGAQLKVDGLRGPLTRAAEQQFMGSPTSVRTPSFTSAPTRASFTSGRGDEGRGVPAPFSMKTQNMRVPTQAIPASQVAPVGENQATFNRPAIQTPAIHQPYSSNPYTGSTGGANAIVAPRQVPTSSIKAGPLPGAQLPSYNQGITYPSAIQAGAKPVATTAVSPGRNGPFGNVWGGFSRPAIQTPTIHQPYSINPYAGSTGGANAIQIARLPQPRPAYPPPSVSVASEATLMQQLHDKMQRDAAAASQNSRSGAGYSGGGGGYVGGGYGGYGGSNIGSGVGGAFRNR